MSKMVARGRGGMFVPRRILIQPGPGKEVKLVVQSQKPGEPIFFEADDPDTLAEFFLACIRAVKKKGYALPFYDDARSHYLPQTRWGKRTSTHHIKRKE